MHNCELMRNVLIKEASAIRFLAENITEKHDELLCMCSSCKGKIIITGMGKSGHVARKISATMSSLGTPSIFLHPSEAAHGDLGMVEEHDVVMMISKSGETEELRQLINSLKIIGCKLIGIFCEKDSTLEKFCDLTIVLPMGEEACVNNLAPTVSTTLTMAFGDALAVTLSANKGFGKNEFALFHPKGSLGKQLLLTVYDLANKEINEISVNESSDIKSVLWHITQNRLGAVGITNDNGILVGLISDGDIRRSIEKDEAFLSRKASEIMTKQPVVINEETLAVDAFKLMRSNMKSVLPIVDESNCLKGIVSFHDIVSAGVGGMNR